MSPQTRHAVVPQRLSYRPHKKTQGRHLRVGF